MAQRLIADQHVGHVGGTGISLSVANAIASSMAWLAPWPALLNGWQKVELAWV